MELPIRLFTSAMYVNAQRCQNIPGIVANPNQVLNAKLVNACYKSVNITEKKTIVKTHRYQKLILVILYWPST
jgi:hypothetical protein